MDFHPITENCRITPEIQNLLSRKRMSLGLSYRMLGEYFHLSWSTFRKWECGDSSEMKCRRFHLKTLNSYLNGEHDDRMPGPSGIAEVSCPGDRESLEGRLAGVACP